MKKDRKVKLALGALVLMVFSFSLGSGEDRGPADRDHDRAPVQDRTVFASRGEKADALSSYMDNEIAKGNLKLASTEVEDMGMFVHERYDVYYRGLQVWGAQLLRHRRNDEVYLINGDLHTTIDIDITPSVTEDQAALMAATGLTDPAYSLEKGQPLMIYPGSDGYHLVFRVTYAKFDSRIVSLVDAKTGQIVFRFEDIKTSSSIGRGTGILGDIKKLSTEFKDNTYYAIDTMRPAQITTADSRNSYNIGSAYYVTDSDNNWTDDGTVVDGHAYLGWTYDYFYLVHGRKGVDNNNRDLVLTVHLGVKYENAFFNPSTKWMYFGDGNPATTYPFATALDIVAHEYTHGITDATSNLNYVTESGALNEAFSDIMAVSCEFFQQPEGNGYMKAEWWHGEDIEKNFRPGRSLANPSSVRIWAAYNYFYPDHYSKRYILPADIDHDGGGVHINSTIPSHWYYLLAHGGKNKTSGISVTGIGLSKAEKIAYRTWVNYLHPTSNFKSARAASYQAAVDLYGAGSPEAQTVRQAWTAVGVN